jgi:hypothetical protein
VQAATAGCVASGVVRLAPLSVAAGLPTERGVAVLFAVTAGLAGVSAAAVSAGGALLGAPSHRPAASPTPASAKPPAAITALRGKGLEVEVASVTCVPFDAIQLPVDPRFGHRDGMSN